MFSVLPADDASPVLSRKVHVKTVADVRRRSIEYWADLKAGAWSSKLGCTYSAQDHLNALFGTTPERILLSSFVCHEVKGKTRFVELGSYSK